MLTGGSTRVVLIVPLIAVWGCRSEPDASGVAANSSPRTAPEAPSRPEPKAQTDQPPGQPVAKSPRPEEGERLKELLKDLRKAPVTAPPLRARMIPTGDPELGPLVAFLRAEFAEEIKAGKRLVIEDRTDLGPLLLGMSYQEFVASLLDEAKDKVPAEVIRDFDEKNRQSHAVWPELSRHLPVRVLSREEHKAIFTANPDDNWKRFYERYPDAPGIITVSRVGLNRDKNLALFYMGVGRGSLNAGGQLYVLKKEGDEWVDQRISIGPSWQS
jgi:hypothetical protein